MHKPRLWRLDEFWKKWQTASYGRQPTSVVIVISPHETGRKYTYCLRLKCLPTQSLEGMIFHSSSPRLINGFVPKISVPGYVQLWKCLMKKAMTHNDSDKLTWASFLTLELGEISRLGEINVEKLKGVLRHDSVRFANCWFKYSSQQKKKVPKDISQRTIKNRRGKQVLATI